MTVLRILKMKRRNKIGDFFLKSMFVTLPILLMGGQSIFAQEKPFWTNGYFYDANNSYIEIATDVGWEISDARKKAYQQIINRRSLAAGAESQVSISSKEISVESNHDLIVKSRILDEYIEQPEPGIYKIYLLVQTAKNPTFQFESVKITNKYPFSVRSFVPGWQQIYKGSIVKGGVIIGAETIGIGGLVTCFSMKGSYDKLIEEDPKHTKEYSQKADVWQNVGFGFVAYTAAVYVYNLIDAAVAPGQKRIFVSNALTFTPSVDINGSIGVAMRYNF